MSRSSKQNIPSLSNRSIIINEESLQEMQKNFRMDFGYNTPDHGIIDVHGYSSAVTTFKVTIDSSVFSEEEIKEMKKSSGFASFGTQEVDDKEVYFLDLSYSDKGGITDNKDQEGVIKSVIQNIKNIRKVRARQKDVVSNIKDQEVSDNFTSKELPKSEILLEKKIQDVAQIILSKKVHFFTGAGMSVNIIPDWNGLMSLMGFKLKGSSQENLKTTMQVADPSNLENLMKGIHSSHIAFVEGRQTDAHIAIGEISMKTGNSILTDNRDLVQQNGGFNATHVMQIDPFCVKGPPWAQDKFSLDPKEVDALVVCGMGGDRRGFIKWLKAGNPEVKIIHMDLYNSEFLESDIFIQGDVQETIPALAKMVETLTKDPAVKISQPSGNALQSKEKEKQI